MHEEGRMLKVKIQMQMVAALRAAIDGVLGILAGAIVVDRRKLVYMGLLISLPAQ
jgi:hypothetical protein